MPSSFDAHRNKHLGGLVNAAISLDQPVFPCGADKRPMTEHGFKDASRDHQVIQAMFSRPGCALIGMPTGELTGVVIIDVDNKENRQGKSWLDANSHRMPQTRTIRTGSGGLHIYLAWPGQRVKNSNDRIAPGIDVRGDGGYVIVPPSTGYVVADDAPIADVPDWLMPVLCPAEVVHAPSERRHVPTSGGTSYGLAALTGECEAIRLAGFGQQETALNTAGLKIGALIAGGEIEQGLATAELLAAARGMPSQPGRAPWSANQIDTKIRRAIQAGMTNPRGAPAIEPEPVHPAAALIAKMHARSVAPSKPLPVATSLMDVEGALKMFVDHCETTAISRQPFLALAAGICAIGALAGRRYRTRTNLRTNVYAVGIADSGGGKDHARKQLKAVMGAANLTHYMGGEDIASGSAVMTALSRHPSILFQIDEFGDWLANVLGPKAATHKKQIAERLKTLYSSADSWIAGTEYADQTDKGRRREDIQQPHACLYGTTTPGQFWAAIASGSMHDGLMARLLIFVSADSYPDENEADHLDPPIALVEAFQAISRGVGSLNDLGGLMLSTTAPEPYLVPEAAGVDVAIRALRQEQLAMQRKHQGTYVTAIAARWAENAVKLALVRSVSRDPAKPVMTVQDVAWGRALTKHCIDTLLQDAEKNVADTQHGRDTNKALEIIRKHGPVTERDMIRRGFKMNDRDRASVLKTLIDGGYVLAVPKAMNKEGGRPTIRYHLAANPQPDDSEDDLGSGIEND